MIEAISKLRHNFSEYIWPGLGLFGESYLLFSIGTLKPIWSILYPQCFQTNEICTPTLLHTLSYSVVIGIIIGMVSMGILAGKIGRRNGSIFTATLMMIGSLGLTLGSIIYSDNAKFMVENLVSCLFVFGIGVGGEYPLSASSASERAMSELKRRLDSEEGGSSANAGLSHHDHYVQTLQLQPQNDFNNEDSLDQQNDTFHQGKGKRVILVFSMQGMGIFINTLTITLLLLITGQYGSANNDIDYYNNNNNNLNDDGNNEKDDQNGVIVGYYDYKILVLIWRIVYAFGALTLIYVLLSRILYLQESEVWAEDKKKRQEMKDDNDNNDNTTNEYNFQIDGSPYVQDDDEQETNGGQVTIGKLQLLKINQTQLFYRHYWHRLFGTSTAWLLWDVAFYGNKLFQSTFLYALTGKEATLFEISYVALLNALISLLGYYAAASLIDRPIVGRVRLQKYGFLFTGTLFCLCGFYKDDLPTNLLILMYFGSSFFGQCGPNCTTFLIPAEIFPTEMRTMCHGLSAAFGKIGALIAAVVFNHLSESGMFLLSGYCSFLAWLITWIFIPDTTTLDLHQIDKKWRLILEGKLHEYRGDANEFKHMSSIERWNILR